MTKNAKNSLNTWIILTMREGRDGGRVALLTGSMFTFDKILSSHPRVARHFKISEIRNKERWQIYFSQFKAKFDIPRAVFLFLINSNLFLANNSMARELKKKDWNNRQINKHTRARILFFNTASVSIRLRNCLLRCLSLDNFSGNKTLVNLRKVS